MDPFGFSGFFGLAIVLGVGILGVIVLAIVAIVSGRGEPDPDARRTPALYATVLAFLSLFTLLIAGVATAQSLLEAAIVEDPAGSFEAFPEPIFPDGDGFEFDEPPSFDDIDTADADDARYASAVQSGLIALAAGAVFLFHRRLFDGRAPGAMKDAAWRVFQAYGYAVCFVAVLIVLFGAAGSLYGLFRIIAPGVTAGFLEASVERREGLVTFLSAGLLALGAAAIFRANWEGETPSLRLRRGPGAGTPPPAPGEPAGAPTTGGPPPA
ncbi:MAG TPA: hypothetical protein VM618_11205 [Acidimicrobiia bacterium]|nr:hypothetical protein [Acidimicrobiia bacterium]